MQYCRMSLCPANFPQSYSIRDADLQEAFSVKGLILTWLLTALGVSSAFLNPYNGFLVYVAFAILRPDSLWSSHITGGRFSFFVASAMLLNWFIRACGNWNLGPSRRITMLFVGYWLWSVFLAFRADSPPHAWYFVEQQAKILLPFLVGITTIKTSADLRKLAWVIVVCQGYVSFELNTYYFSGFNYLWEVGFGGLDNNSMAIGLVTALGVAFFLFFYESSYLRRFVITGCAAFIGHAILFSFSRGAMLATVLFAVVSFFIIRKTTLHYAVFGIGLLMAVVLAGPQVRDRFMETFSKKDGVREASAQSRLDLWRDCAILLARDPIMGCGPDHWPLHAHEFGWPAGKEAHSLWVQTAVELGIPGITMYLGFFLTTIWRCWLLLQRTKNDDDAWFADSARMTIASLCAYMVAAQFVSLEALEIPYYVVLLGAGSMTVHYRLAGTVGQTSTSASENMDHVYWEEAKSVETANDYNIDEEADSIYETPFRETTATLVFAASQASDWRDAIELSPKPLDGIEHPLVMN